MQIIIIDGFHKGHVIDWHTPEAKIKLLKPKVITTCACNEDLERYEAREKEIEYTCAFKSIDNKVALFSTTGNSIDIFGDFDQNWHENPWKRNRTVLELNCHDPQAFV